MAKLDQIELPNGVTYDFDDKYARKLTNNDFDTINVTELNAGDLIVTGVGRFTNGLYGNLIGNADTATSAIKATQDESGNNIKSTYANGISISDHTITLKNKNGTSLGTVTVPDNNTTYTVATGTANGKIKVTPSSGNAYEVSVYGLKSAAYKDVTDTYSETGTDPVSGKAVKSAIDGLPSPMVFRGTVGTGGTITNVPTDGTAVVGDTYKVITNGVYGGKTAKVGDTLICLTKTSTANTWELVPSGDEPSGTVTSVAIANGGGLSVSGSPITSSGTITISHADTSSQASVNNSGRTYIQDITLDTYGHVTGIASATETVVNTDRYVNSAAFADATSADANNPVKMTLTRAGSDTASVTAYIPKVSSSSAGVVPKGATVSSQSQTTKFLREDGTWAAPSYTPVIDNLTSSTSTTSALSAKQGYLLANGSARDSTKLPLAGGTLTGRVVYNNVSMPLSAGKVTGLSAGTTEVFKDAIAFSNPATSNDVGWVRVLGTGESDTVLEIATGDDGGGTTAEKIVARQYNTSNAIVKEAVLLAPNGTTSFPVSVTSPKFIGDLDGNTYEAKLQWGGKNFAGSYGCLDAVLMDELGANRFQFIKASAITVEYSRDAGETWTDYGATDAQKQQIFAQGGGLVIGKADSTNKATEHPGEYQLRITIDTGVANIYTYLNKFVVYVSTNNSGGCLCKIQKALQSTPTTFVDHTDWITVTGWSGYNVLNTSYLVTYGNTASNQYGRVRFIFKDTESTGTSYNGLTVYQIKGFGGVGWSTPSTMAKTGHLYAINENQDATFPANVTATNFNGNLIGNADTASKLGSSNIGSATNPIYLASGTATACTYTLGKSVPSDAVFTDTKNTAGSTDTSSKIYLIGATSQAANPQTYSQDTAYVGTDGCLYSGGSKVLTAHQDISGKVSKTGDTMTGCLSITSANTSWAEGIRINRGAGGFCSFTMGGVANSTSGTGDNVWWLGCNPASYSHKWFVAHNGSYQTGTYFYVDSSSQISPHLRVGGDLAVGSKTTASKSCTLRYNDSTLSMDFIFTT